MLQWIVALPLISVLIERLLEVFDLLVTLNLLPFWRTAPPPPPRMFLQRPSRKTWRKGQQPGTPSVMSESEQARVVHAIGSDTLEFPVSSYQEAVLYYEKEKALYRNRLKHYVNKYGHFLPHQASVTGDLWVQSSSWPLRLESRLARQERIPDVGKEAQFARLIRDVSLDTMINERTRIQILEKLTDYCYLRNHYTYLAFSFLKRQVYLVLGMVLGVLIVEVLYQGNLLAPIDGPAVWGTTSGLLEQVVPSAQQVLDLSIDPASWVFRAIFGALAGSISQPIHGLINRAVYGSLDNLHSSSEPDKHQRTRAAGTTTRR
jgi:hypothetical protein